MLWAGTVMGNLSDADRGSSPEGGEETLPFGSRLNGDLCGCVFSSRRRDQPYFADESWRIASISASSSVVK